MKTLRLWLYTVGSGSATGFALGAAWLGDYIPAAMFAAASVLYLCLLKGEL